MTAVASQPAPLSPFSDAGAIPSALKDQKRWAPWRAVWNDKRKKYDKIPHRADRPEYGISTAKPEQWFSFDTALAAYHSNPKMFAGIGYCMTSPHGVVGIDLDNCVADGVVAPWAAEVVQQLGSYTETSPSGTGLRIMVRGSIPADWNNHEVGIEVYGGNEARFLTLTGKSTAGAPPELRSVPADALQALEGRYAKERRKAEVIDLAMPDIVDDLLLPSLENLDISYAARDFLESGAHRGDRSRELFSTAVALYSAGLQDDEVFSILAHNPHAMEIALDHRRQDQDRALMYLWREQCCKGKARATPRITADEFDVVAIETGIPALRFQFQQAGEFVKRQPLRWLIKRVLPQAPLCILFGPSGSGKTFVTLDMVCAIARGVEWRSHKVRQGNAAYICAEGAGGFQNRLLAYARHHGIRVEDLPISVLDGAPNFLLAQDIKDVLAGLKQLGALDVIVVDTLARVMAGGNENASVDMNRVIDNCGVLHKATGALVILVAHTGKDVSAGVRGWSGQKGAADVQIEVVRSGDDRALVIDKMKEGPGEGDEYGFKLANVTIGVDEDGDDITSCVVEHTVALPKSERKAAITGDYQVAVVRTLQKLANPDGVFANDLLDAVVEQFTWDQSSGKRDTRRQNCLRALNALRTANHIGEQDGRLVPL